MRISSLHFGAAALQLATSVSASPLDLTSNFKAAVNAFECRAVNFLVNAGREAAAATTFCSSYLSVPVATTTKTVAASSTATKTVTVTGPISTTYAPTSTYSVLVLQVISTSTYVRTTTTTTTATQYITGARSTKTTTTTIPFQPQETETVTTSTTSTGTVTVISTPAVVAAWETCRPQKRGLRVAAAAPCPTMWQALASQAISTACSCLSIPRPTTTVQLTTTASTTLTTTSTPTTTITSTVTARVTSTATDPAIRYDSTVSTSTTVTKTATSTVTEVLTTVSTTIPVETETATVHLFIPPTATTTTTSMFSVTKTVTSTAPTPTQLVFDILDNTGLYVGDADVPMATVLGSVSDRPSSGFYHAGDRLVEFATRRTPSQLERSDLLTYLYLEPLGAKPAVELTWSRAADGTLTVRRPATYGGTVLYVYRTTEQNYLFGTDSPGSGFVYVQPIKAVGRC